MPQHKRGPWSQNEDSFLMSLVQTYSPSNWVRISQAIQTRTPKQCRERYHQNLKPSLNHEPITPEEGLLIEQMVHDMGKRWAEIARRLHGRSDNAVKNWWNGGMNRRRRGNHGGTIMRRPAYDMTSPSPQAHQQQPYQNSAHSAPVAAHQQQTQQQQQQQAPLYQQAQQQHYLTAHQQPQQQLPSAFPPHLYGMPAYHGPMAHPVRMPPNGAGLRPHAHGLVETPLPSPSAYSADGAPPSLISDSSSMSTRSPHSGASPVDLPPLGAAGNDGRRHSAIVPLGIASNSYETGYQMHMHAPVDKRASYPPQQHASFVAQKQYAQPTQSQYHQVSAPQQYMAQAPMDHQAQRLAATTPAVHVQYGVPQQQHQQATQAPPPPPPQHLLPSQPIQLPSIASLPRAGDQQQQQQFDASHGRAGETPAPYGQSPDGSPRDKMSLSNLTH